MCSIVEPRRVTVSCKHIFSSCINEYSSSKRRFNNQISKILSKNDKSLRTSTNTYSSRFPSETSDYGSSTDIETFSYYSYTRRKSSLSSLESDSNNLILYYYEKENHSTRKRSRRYFNKSQSKRIKISNRKQYFIKFSIDLTGQNINYTNEYHQKIIFLPFYYDFYYISWLQTYYYYYFYSYYYYCLQLFNRECEEKLMAIFFFVFLCFFLFFRD
jgi:hypothetical protein